MATDFTITAATPVIYPGVSATYTLTLNSVAGSNVTFALTDDSGGVFSSTAPVITAGLLTTTFTYTPLASASAPATITAVASGGLVKTHSVTSVLNYQLTGATTATQIINQALGLLGVKSPGESVEPTELADLLERLNMMIDGWSAIDTFAYASQRVTALFASGTTTATIGPSGDFVLPQRPVKIGKGSFFTSSNYDYPIDVINIDDYNAIGYKNVPGFGPSATYYIPSLPNGKLYFYPQATGPITLIAEVNISSFPDLTTAYTLGPGYKRALAYSFAEEISADYGRQVAPSIARIAAMSRRDIQRANLVVPSLSRYVKRGNILTGWENA